MTWINQSDEKLVHRRHVLIILEFLRNSYPFVLDLFLGLASNRMLSLNGDYYTHMGCIKHHIFPCDKYWGRERLRLTRLWQLRRNVCRLFLTNGGRRHSLDLFLRRTRLMKAMPMSPIDSILGIPGLVILKVKRVQDIHVWVRPRKQSACVYCASNQGRIKATYQRTLKHTRQGNQLVPLHLSIPKYHCTHISDTA